MIGTLRAYLERRRKWRRLRRKQEKRFARWLAANPGGSYGEFYAEDMRRQIDAGSAHMTLGIDSVDRDWVKTRARRVLGAFKQAGCGPDHVVVDYGCGSLWIGEAFMNYLEPGNYIGLDVSDTFFAERLGRMSPDFVANRKPMLRVISDATLCEVRARQPDFILSIAVMRHVPPKDLPDYFARIVSLAGPRTRVEICHEVGLRTKWQPPRRWRHSRYAVRSALAPLGHTADFRPGNRVMRTAPGFRIVRC